MADLCVVQIFEGMMPFQKCIELAGGYDLEGKLPKLAAIAKRTVAYPAVAEYMAKTTSMKLAL